MKTPLNDDNHKQFTDVVESVFQNTLDSMFDKKITVSFSQVSSGGADDLVSGFEGQTLILATEEKTGMEAGLMFHTKDITHMANLMMMMDEPGKDTLEQDDKDAIKEMASQLLAACSVPVEEKTETKVSFRVDDVMVNDAPALFQADTYMIADASLGIDDDKTVFRFFTDLNLMGIFGNKKPAAGGDEEPDFGTAFKFPDDDGMDMSDEGHGGMGHPHNLDLLLDIDVPVSVKMGSTSMFLKDILTMSQGNIIELDESADEPVELVINNKVIARGEVVIVDGYFGFRIKEIVSRAERIKKLKD